MRPTRVVPEALGLMKATQGELSLLWGRLLQNCQILFPALEQDAYLLSMSPVGKISLNMQVHWLTCVHSSVRSLYF